VDLCPKCFKGERWGAGEGRGPGAPSAKAVQQLVKDLLALPASPGEPSGTPPSCFPTPEGKFPAGMCAKDFIRLEASEAVPDESGWTDQETLLLLEGARQPATMLPRLASCNMRMPCLPLCPMVCRSSASLPRH
jgi:hypothetical protein